MTKRQAQVLDFVKRYQRDNLGASPSFREIAAHIGLTAVSGVHRLVLALEEQGYLRRRIDAHRSIEIIKLPEVA